MKNNQDFQYILSQAEQENIQPPDDLNESAIRAQLNSNVRIAPLKKVRHPQVARRRFMALAACLLIFLTSFSAIEWQQQQRQRTIEINDNLITFVDYAGVENMVRENSGSSWSVSDIWYALPFPGRIRTMLGTVAEDGVAKSAGEVMLENSAMPDTSHAETNKQVETVDEADIIKTDGQYIYCLTEEKLVIFAAQGGETEKVASIYLANEIENTDDICFQEMFIYNQQLIIIATENQYEHLRGDTRTNTLAVIYDISDRENPSLKNTFKQSGDYTSARMVGQYLYLISGYGDYDLEYKHCIPYCTRNDGTYGKLPIEDICAVKNSPDHRFAVVSAIDTAAKKQSKKTKAILGISENIYCNDKHLYLTGTHYETFNGKTTIIKYRFDKTKIELAATGKVKGYTNDQFSLDEKDGNLRIATTSADTDTGKDKNYLFVLDENLKIIGDVSGFARNEHIEAVRYIGDMAYVITFERTDPLFIIDLSQPTAPKITGEVKIDGFSTTLTPVDNTTLLGIGYCTDENEYGGVYTNGLKLTLFDISDKNKPKVIDTRDFKEAESPAQNSHKAIVINRAAGYFAIPLNDYSKDNQNGVLVIQTGEKLNAEFKRSNSQYITRCTYIGDYLYAVEEDANEIYAFQINSY